MNKDYDLYILLANYLSPPLSFALSYLSRQTQSSRDNVISITFFCDVVVHEIGNPDIVFHRFISTFTVSIGFKMSDDSVGTLIQVLNKLLEPNVRCTDAQVDCLIKYITGIPGEKLIEVLVKKFFLTWKWMKNFHKFVCHIYFNSKIVLEKVSLLKTGKSFKISLK